MDGQEDYAVKTQRLGKTVLKCLLYSSRRQCNEAWKTSSSRLENSDFVRTLNLWLSWHRTPSNRDPGPQIYR